MPSAPLLASLVAVAVLGSPAPAPGFPFLGKSRCKEERGRLEDEAQALRDRQRQARRQCEAALDSGHDRCRSLKRRHKDELRSFSEQAERQLDECERRAKEAKRAPRDDDKK
jgi:hypothetical protein